MAKRKNKITKTELISVDWVQLKVRVPTSVRDRFNEEARQLGKSNDSYFLSLWDLHDESYRKLLTQKQLEITKELKKK